MIECGSCHTTVEPTKKISWLLAGFLLLLFWPGAILYILTRPKNTCPICGSRIQVPRASAPATAHQEASSQADPEPSSHEHVTPSPRLWGNRPVVDKAQSARNLRNLMLAALVFVLGVGAICGVAISAIGGGDSEGEKQAKELGFNPGRGCLSPSVSRDIAAYMTDRWTGVTTTFETRHIIVEYFNQFGISGGIPCYDDAGWHTPLEEKLLDMGWSSVLLPSGDDSIVMYWYPPR